MLIQCPNLLQPNTGSPDGLPECKLVALPSGSLGKECEWAIGDICSWYDSWLYAKIGENYVSKVL
jgi:hypothetical protein